MNLVEMYLDIDINKFTEEDKVRTEFVRPAMKIKITTLLFPRVPSLNSIWSPDIKRELSGVELTILHGILACKSYTNLNLLFPHKPHFLMRFFIK